RPGDRVVTGQPLATLLTDAPEAVDRARAALEGAFTLGDSSDCRPIVVGHVD
ncbi:thymidine phosphorylase, partial [Cutibacterium granulosum TM11]